MGPDYAQSLEGAAVKAISCGRGAWQDDYCSILNTPKPHVRHKIGPAVTGTFCSPAKDWCSGGDLNPHGLALCEKCGFTGEMNTREHP